MNKETTIKKVNGDVFGTGVEGSGNFVVKELIGNVFHLNITSPEGSKLLKEIVDVSTAFSPSEVAGIQGGKKAQDNEVVLKGIDEILEKSGQSAKDIQAGDLKISRVDLLLKKAKLLGAEADQKFFNYYVKNLEKVQHRIAVKSQSGSSVFDFMVNQDIQKEICPDYEWTAHMAKIKESYALLKEANELDPTNTEVLLHMASLLIFLTPDDTRDEIEILYRIRSLLGYPKDDTERFYLAQATFLLAISMRNNELLRDARALFEKLAQHDWIRAIDQLIVGTQDFPGTSQLSSQAGFQPVGQWQIQISEGSTMFLSLNPDGTFQATQQRFGLSIHGMGQWLFYPSNQMLQMQGLVNGYQPYMLGIMIHGQQNNGYFGVGTDGFSYSITRA